MRRFSKNNQAFTLIELLIVVAIIAILAAIAVPNFLEAQVRSKISASKSNLRSVATALESYQVDNNQYPLDLWDDYARLYPYLSRLVALTTPIAYLSSVPADPFATAGKAKTFWDNMGQPNPYEINGATAFPMTYDYISRPYLAGASAGTMMTDEVWATVTGHPDVALWSMRGLGPNLEAVVLGSRYPTYDPTNGTQSAGLIYWSGPGIGPDSPEDEIE